MCNVWEPVFDLPLATMISDNSFMSQSPDKTENNVEKGVKTRDDNA